MKLYNYWRSSSSYRVRIALHFKGLPFEYVVVKLNEGEQHQPQHRQRSAWGSVPVLEATHDGRTVHIAQSVAIAEFLEEQYPEKPFFPSDAAARATMRSFVEIINSGIQPFHNLSTLNYVRDEAKADEKRFAQHFVGLGLTALEAMAKQTSGTFVLGDTLTWADACLLPQLFGARRFGVDTTKYPTLHRIEAKALAHEAVKRAAPEAQVDAVPA